MSRKQVGVKAIGWFDEDGLPVLRLVSSLADQDALIKAFIGQKVELREINDNSIELFAVQEEKPATEKENVQTMTKEQLQVLAAKHGVVGVDGRTSKPNIIAALRKHANAQSD